MKELIRRTPLYRPLHNYRAKIEIKKWEEAGKPIPAPTYYKQLVIKDLSRKSSLTTFVETGTYKGYMIQGLLPYFKKLYSIEIYQPLYEKAKKLFANQSKVNLILGDSADKIPELMNQLEESALFWLDGHYSGEGTGTATEHSPIMQELKPIFEHTIKNHVLLIDDARFFNGKDGYPTIEELEKFTKENSHYSHFSVKDDLILIQT